MRNELGVAGLALLAGCHLLLGYEDEPPGGSGGQGAQSQGGSGSIRGSGGAQEGGKSGGEPGGGGMGAMGEGGGCQVVGEDAFNASPDATPSDDDFTSASATLARWGARFFVVNEGGYIGATHCSATLCDGVLRLRPGTPSTNKGYYWRSTLGNTQNQSGPIVYQRVSGDFALEVDVELLPNGSTIDDYTGASLVVRNPTAFNHYVSYSFGRQATGLGTVGRLRHPGGIGNGETIVLGDPTPTTATRGRLLLCRLGGEFSFHRSFDGDPGSSTDSTTVSLDIGFGDVPEVEVGLSVHWYQGMASSYDGLFRNPRFHPAPASHQACRALLDG
ncbi:MAG: hypothetical protein R3B72_39690 [Polyangiaceae bacterium]